MQLTATTTGSGSIRLTWDPTQMPSSRFTVYRGPDSTFAHAAAIGSGALPVGTPWFNDYTASQSTTYFYWLQDQNAVQAGPASATTAARWTNQEALDEPQMNALAAWAASVWSWLYPVLWRYQPVPALRPPRITLNPIVVNDPGEDDGLDNYGEALVGARVATISVQVVTDPAPADRGQVSAASLGAGTYTLTLNSQPLAAVFGSAPANGTAVTTALQALVDAAGGFSTGLYGSDPNNQALLVENADPTMNLALGVSGNLVGTVSTAPKAMTIAQRLHASLGDNAQRDALFAAGIGVGKRNAVQDVSAMLETQAQLIAQFDFFVNLAEVYPVSDPLIDTVQTPTGTFNS